MSHHLVGMAEIAEIIGVSRQRVSQLVESYDDFPEPEVELSGGRVWSRTAIETWIASHPEREPGRPEAGKRRPRFFGRKQGAMFDRFTDLARASIVKAQEEARLMNHNYIGTEHLLLGLLAIQDGVAFRVLRQLDVSLDAIRDEIIAMIGRGPTFPEAHLPFTPRSQKVLELALREALQLGHNYVGTEHVLLALVREGQGVAWLALEKLGLKQKATRTAVLSALQGFAVATKVSKKAKAVTLSCTFCGKTQSDVAKLVAGPGVFICNECIDLCNEIIEEESAAPEEKPASDVLSRLEYLESRIADLESREDS